MFRIMSNEVGCSEYQAAFQQVTTAARIDCIFV